MLNNEFMNMFADLWDMNFWKKMDDKFVAEVEAPGYTKDEVTVSVEGKLVRVRANNDLRGLRRLDLRLPGNPEKADLNASMNNGLLTLEFIPSVPHSRTVEVK
jgi:HSP20 family molecular chaperone IbpA